MYNTYLTEIDFNVGIYIRLSQEDKERLIKELLEEEMKKGE